MHHLGRNAVKCGVLLVCLWCISLQFRHHQGDDIPGSCNIPILDPFDQSILDVIDVKPLPACPPSPQLTYMDGDWIRVNKTHLKDRYRDLSVCEYKPIHRVNNNDNRVFYGLAVILDLQHGEKIYDEFIQVSCYSKGSNRTLVYRNYHVTAPRKRFVEERTTKYRKSLPSTRYRWNVLLLGTDSMTLSSSVRYLPRTRQYLLDILKANVLSGYTKAGLNTFPCMMPLLSGLPATHAPEWKSLEHLTLIFKEYENKGYTTFFSEDRPDITLFNTYHKGFKKPLADYYFRPMALDMAKYMNNVSYVKCEKEMFMTRLIMDYLQRFVSTIKSQPFLAFMYLVELSHDDLTLGRRLDELYLDLFKSLERLKIWENTILLFYSDHGARFGDVLKSPVGRLERRLPMLYIALPQAFKDMFPHFVKNLKKNEDKLVTAYDIHRTLQDIIDLSNGAQAQRGAMAQNLFSEISKQRTCKSANIPLQFCTCLQRMPIRTNQSHVQETALFLVQEINTILLDSRHLCAKLTLHSISSADILGTKGGDTEGSATPIYQVSFVTTPGYGLFEGTVRIKQGLTKGSWSLTREGPIGRMNRYFNQSACITPSIRRVYCYCT